MHLFRDAMEVNVVRQMFKPPMAAGQPWYLSLMGLADVEFRPATVASAGEIALPVPHATTTCLLTWRDTARRLHGDLDGQGPASAHRRIDAV